MSEFDDKVVLVTGAGRGLGRAVAAAFAAQGAVVAVNDLTPVNLDHTVLSIRQAGGKVKDYLFDVATKMPVQAMLELIVEEWGRLDVLINNAGVEPRATLLDMDEWDWRRTIDVNLTGPFFLMQSAARLMRPTGGGVILNMAADVRDASHLMHRGAFIASKTGLLGLTRAAAREFAPYNIRVNAVCPGGIDTGKSYDPLEATNAILAGRAGVPQDAAELVLFLCGPRAAYLTGQAVYLNGGSDLI